VIRMAITPSLKASMRFVVIDLERERLTQKLYYSNRSWQDNDDYGKTA
jgi:hypothetical protein